VYGELLPSIKSNESGGCDPPESKGKERERDSSRMKGDSSRSKGKERRKSDASEATVWEDAKEEL
jgi:hypothetical protein